MPDDGYGKKSRSGDDESKKQLSGEHSSFENSSGEELDELNRVRNKLVR